MNLILLVCVIFLSFMDKICTSRRVSRSKPLAAAYGG